MCIRDRWCVCVCVCVCARTCACVVSVSVRRASKNLTEKEGSKSCFRLLASVTRRSVGNHLITRTGLNSILTRFSLREHSLLHLWLSIINNNNNDNEYLERLTRTGPKRLHVLYKYIYCQNSMHTTWMHTHTHAHTQTQLTQKRANPFYDAVTGSKFFRVVLYISNYAYISI